jgi:Ca2+/Na+ antiporter
MTDPFSSPAPPDPDEAPSFLGLTVSLGILALFLLFWFLQAVTSHPAFTLCWLLSAAAFISVVIWQACDPFADAAQWVGERFRLPGSVRGATLDAVASSMPELFSGIFFVIVALSAAGSDPENQAARIEAGAEGYGSTIATCAGSAVYNMILIPAFCALVISFTRASRPTIDVEDEVISRDGMWSICCQFLLVIFLFGESMEWWMGLVFILLYGIYISQLYRDAQKYRAKMRRLKSHFEREGVHVDVEEVVSTLTDSGVRVSEQLVLKARTEVIQEKADIDDDEAPPTPTADVLFGYFQIPLNFTTAWVVILLSTLAAATACYFLVITTLATAEHLEIPAFFVAVILAAAASSVPDTFLAIGAARRGDDSGAVSNAFGSNIFDICICISIPLLINSWLTGWQPVSLLQDGEPMRGLVGLRLLLALLTIVTLAVMWHNRQLTRNKAIALCGLYAVFIAYAVMGSLGFLF